MKDTRRGLAAVAALLAAFALALALLPAASVSAYADGEEGDEEAEETEEATATVDESDAEEESEDTEDADEEESEDTDEDDDSEVEDTDVTIVTYVISDDLGSVTIADGTIAYFEYTPSESGYQVVTFATNEIYYEYDEETGEETFSWYITSDVDGYGAGFENWNDDGTVYSNPYFTLTLEAGETYVFAFENRTGSDIVVSSVTAEVAKSITDDAAELTYSLLTYELPEDGLSWDDVYADIIANLTITYDGVELVCDEDYGVSLWADDPITSPGSYEVYVAGLAAWGGDSDYYGYVVLNDVVFVTLPSSSLIELTVDGGAVEATLEADGTVYYCFTPTSDGYYQVSLSASTAWAEVLNSDWAYMNIDDIYADSEETGVNGGYFEAGKTYYIAVYDYSGEEGTVSVEVSSWDAPVVEITELDVAYEITSSEDWWVSYAVFAPTTSGTYTITLEFAEGSYAEFWLIGENGYDVYYEESWEDDVCTIVVDLEAGVTYQLQLYMFGFDEDGSTTTDGSYTLTVTVSSDEEGAGLASTVLGGTTGTADSSTTDTSSTSSSSTSSSSSSDSTVPATGDDAASAAAPLVLAGVAACALGLALRRRRAR